MSYIDLLRQRNPRLLFSGQTAAMVGQNLHDVALNLVTYDLTGSAMMMALVNLASRSTLLVAGLFGGAVADGYPRRPLLFWSYLLNALSVAVLPLLHAMGSLTAWHLAAVRAVVGICRAVFTPALQAELPELAQFSCE